MKYFAPPANQSDQVILNLKTGLLERDFKREIIGIPPSEIFELDKEEYELILLSELTQELIWNKINDFDRRELVGILLHLKEVLVASLKREVATSLYSLNDRDER